MVVVVVAGTPQQQQQLGHQSAETSDARADDVFAAPPMSVVASGKVHHHRLGDEGRSMLPVHAPVPITTAAPPATSASVLRVGCVPEHFSTPLILAARSLTQLLHVEIVNCPGGTGEMIRLLTAGTIDVACALTEGLVVPLARHFLNSDTDPSFRIAGSYTSRPLTWAIAVSPNSHLLRNSNDDGSPSTPSTLWRSGPKGDLARLSGCRIGISRFGSGSHIIPHVIAQKHHLPPFSFVELKDINGLTRGATMSPEEDSNDEKGQRCDAFLWERFTTKPLFDNGTLVNFANFDPPWPSFLFAARTGSDASTVSLFLDAVTKSTRRFMDPDRRAESLAAVEDMWFASAQKSEDLREWLETAVGYADDATIVEQGVIERCLEVLLEAGVVTKSSVDIDGLDMRKFLLEGVTKFSV